MDSEPVLLADVLDELLPDELLRREHERHRTAELEIRYNSSQEWYLLYRRAMERIIAHGPGPAEEAAWRAVAETAEARERINAKAQAAIDEEAETHRKNVTAILAGIPLHPPTVRLP